jgi:hypothetical protein
LNEQECQSGLMTDGSRPNREYNEDEQAAAGR